MTADGKPPATSHHDPRDRLAYDRTLLANERTFAAWIRTGLAVAAVGLAAAHFLPPDRAPTLRLALGALFVSVGAVVILLGAWRFVVVNRDLMPAASSRTPLGTPLAIALALVLALLLLGTLLFL